MKSHRFAPRSLVALAALGCVFLLASCSGGGGDDGGGGGGGPNPVEPPPPTTPILGTGDPLPGANIEIMDVHGNHNPVQPGDTISVDFKITLDDGTTELAPADMNTLRIYVSGPTTNYQIVLEREDDVRARSVQNPDGSWRYTFALEIPDVYVVPPNDSPAFGPGDGEMAGEPLLSGTYTVGMEGYKIYSAKGTDYRDTANATLDFLLGNATVLEPREVVKIENCRRCHVDLRAHGGIRREVKLCILCHVSGSEDRNEPTVLNGSPGVSVDFRVMIHKIHSGEHLPSVNGVATNTDGTRNYLATPVPYEIVGNSNSINDFSHVPFPVWPNLTFPMPRDEGYTGLTSAAKAQEDEIRTGVTRCDKCHGDPDGAAGPLTAPAQGGHAYSNSTRRACGSCHDDVDWTLPYRSNFLEMPPQTDDLSCNFCHAQGALSPSSAHVHPINNPSLNPGINFNVMTVAEAGTNNGDMKFQAGEKVAVTFAMADDAGTPVTPTEWAAMSGSVNVVISGPTSNRQLILSTSIPLAAIPGATGPFTFNLNEAVQLEYVGDSTAALESFGTARTPHWAISGAATTVNVRTASLAASTTSAAAKASQNFIDLVAGFSTDPASGFAKDKIVVVDDNVPGKEEYLRIQWVDGNRIWFGQGSVPSSATGYQPGLRYAHAAGAAVQVVTLTAKTVNTDYTLAAATGTITEVAEFGAGNAVLVSYTSDFVWPPIYGTPLNDSPQVDPTYGDWSGLSLESGTYTIGFYASRSFSYAAYNETNSYRNTSVNDSAYTNVLVGTATTLMPNTVISSKDNCNACHDTVYAHGGGREGYNTCILCHGAAGSEDRARFVAPNAPATDTLSIEFREMLHKIHMGEELTNAAGYEIVGFSSAAYPNNFSINTYEEVAFPAMPDGVKNCEKCHGVGNDAWKVPTARNHTLQIMGQLPPTRSWRAVCGSCHDAASVQGHIDSQTSPAGVESCAICHGPGEIEDVSINHLIR